MHSVRRGADWTEERNLPFKHERHTSSSHFLGLQFHGTGLLVRPCVWSMRAHNVVQTRTRWTKPTAHFRIVVSRDQAHELGHDIPVIPWRAKGIFGNEPAGWENDEVSDCRPDVVRWAGQDGKDGRVWVVKGDTSNGVESRKVVFVGIIGAVPGDDIKGSMLLRRREKSIIELADHPMLGRLFLVVKCRSGRLEVASVGESVRPDGPQLGQLKVTLVQLADVASNRTGWECDAISFVCC